MHIFPFCKKTKNFQVLPDPKKRILKVFIVIKTQPLKII
ncbi:anti-sigma F factor antagonist [Lactobacillus crispatus]|uniref:Anti-sigma F factor antagonist n=1 Tax=Lactobacillus crispatus TaxID=47770 RepID=A0A226T811_9LACO|nr:anti-sigma F factor antagonist [Lactobacillus crispatus]PEG83893.1 anti-sigma F factor antagonist [Lactobacillus sp. UMNPBX16]PEG91130.1 anti-sigma F factor antagonist [Lactobacillus sp. UMNPBX12]PEG93047.1 anti-sigma F factor antagonist [Lactobacillus sp. UMNPBX11]PEG99380.1 anti-sigma F factor antagonist [Lactobacillus sp. UMNPBX8]PEH12253.1 anti-sigma F factor antagonist [Lactobacillus sp. UMNPBX1]